MMKELQTSMGHKIKLLENSSKMMLLKQHKHGNIFCGKISVYNCNISEMHTFFCTSFTTRYCQCAGFDTSGWCQVKCFPSSVTFTQVDLQLLVQLLAGNQKYFQSDLIDHTSSSMYNINHLTSCLICSPVISSRFSFLVQ